MLPLARAPRVMVADDDASVRTVVQRLLEREFDAWTVAAADGLQALQIVLRETLDLAVLDLAMPVLDGLEVLTAIRQSPQHGGLPVIVLTAGRDEELVRRVLELGVEDYLVKPFRPTLVIARCARALRRMAESERPATARPDVGLGPGDRVLVVDESPAFRAFFRRHADGYCRVAEAGSGVEALSLCRQDPPAAVVIGSRTGLLGPDQLARQIRQFATLRHVRLVGLVPPGQSTVAGDDGTFDIVLPRTFVPEILRDALSYLLGPDRLAQSLLAPGSPIVGDLARAAVQVLGGMMSQDVEVLDTMPDAQHEERRWMTVAVEVQARDFSVDLELACAGGTGRILAARQAGLRPELVGEVQVAAALSEVVEAVAGRLRTSLAERGIDTDAGHLRTVSESSIGPPASPDSAGPDVILGASDAVFLLRLRLLTVEPCRGGAVRSPGSRAGAAPIREGDGAAAEAADPSRMPDAETSTDPAA